MKNEDLTPILCLVLILLALPCVLIAGENNGSPVGRAVELYDAGKFGEAAAVLDGILKTEPGNAEAHGRMSRVCLGLRRFDDALSHAGQAVKLSPGNSNYHLWLGDAYVRKGMSVGILKGMGMIKKSKEEWRRAVELDPSNIEARYSLAMYYIQAPWVAGGSAGKAREQAEAMVKIDGGAPLGHTMLGMLAQKDKKMADAESQYKLAIAAGGSRDAKVTALGTYARFLIDQKRFDAAISVLLDIVRVAPEEAYSYYALGEGYRAAGRTQDAIEAYKKTMAMNDDFGRGICLFRLGETFEKSGSKPDAVSRYKEYLRRYPNGDKAKDAEKKIKELAQVSK